MKKIKKAFLALLGVFILMSSIVGYIVFTGLFWTSGYQLLAIVFGGVGVWATLRTGWSLLGYIVELLPEVKYHN